MNVCASIFKRRLKAPNVQVSMSGLWLSDGVTNEEIRNVCPEAF
jgi:hypothetical protein